MRPDGGLVPHLLLTTTLAFILYPSYKLNGAYFKTLVFTVHSFIALILQKVNSVHYPSEFSTSTIYTVPGKRPGY